VRARISLIARASDWYVGRETCLAWSVDSHKAAMCLDEVGPRAARTSERRSVHVSSRKALSFRSHQLVRMPPQAEQIACPGEPTAVSDSATWYLAPQAEQEISYILITNSHRLERP
jgi:hypothetical protein